MESFDWKAKTEERVTKLQESVQQARAQINKLSEYVVKAEGAMESFVHMLKEADEAAKAEAPEASQEDAKSE